MTLGLAGMRTRAAAGSLQGRIRALPSRTTWGGGSGGRLEATGASVKSSGTTGASVKSPGTIGTSTMADLLSIFLEDYLGARRKREERYEAGLGELRRVAGMYGPGYMAGQETAAIRGAEQQLIGRGLGGTTRPFATAAGTKARFRDVRQQARAGAMTNIANYMAGFQDIYPDPGTMAHLATGGFSGLLQAKGLGLQEAALTAPGAPLGPIVSGYSSGGSSRTPFMGTSGTPFMGTSSRTPFMGTSGTPFMGTSGGGVLPTYTTPGGSYGGMADTTQRMVGGGAVGSPTPYYGAGGGWADWERTGGEIVPGEMAAAATEKFGPPTPYYEAGGGWRDWEYY